MDHRTVAETFRQIQEGHDIPSAGSLLKGISVANASRRLPGVPYSIVENLYHAVLWQTIWLDKIAGRKPKTFMDDWKTPAPSEFKVLAAQFVKNQSTARRITSSPKLRHKTDSGDTATKLLVGMAIHDAYHMGQINLLKRMLRKSK